MKFLAWVISAAAAFALTACSSVEEDLCDAECACEGCSERDFDDCLRRYDREYSDADYWDCIDLYDAWTECRDETYYCDGRDFKSYCGYERDRLNHCIRR